MVINIDINDPRFIKDYLQPYTLSAIEKYNIENKPVPQLAIVQSVGAGNVIAYYPDEEEHTFTVYNPNEVPCEIGDQINIVDIDGGKKVDFRKTIQFNDVYIDGVNGVDAYADVNGNAYGTLSHPFESLQYAANRLPKNLNNRLITIKCSNLNTTSITSFNGFSSGQITIEEASGYGDIVTTGGMIFNNCSGVYFDLYYLGFTRSDSWAVQIFNSNIIHFNHCEASSSASGGFLISTGSKAVISSSIITNKTTAIRVEILSELYSLNNTGTNNYGLVADGCSTIGKSGTQPSGSIANESVSSGSIIR